MFTRGSCGRAAMTRRHGVSSERRATGIIQVLYWVSGFSMSFSAYVCRSEDDSWRLCRVSESCAVHRVYTLHCEVHKHCEMKGTSITDKVISSYRRSVANNQLERGQRSRLGFCHRPARRSATVSGEEMRTLRVTAAADGAR